MKHAAFLLLLISFAALGIACGTAQGPAATSPIPVNTLAATPLPPEKPPAAAELAAPAETVALSEVEFALYTFKIDSSESVAVAAADFDEDGYLDLVVSGEPNLHVLKGDGQGGFSPLSRPPGGQQPNDFALADLNEDGHIDIVVANHDSDHLTVLRGDGTGQFGLLPKPHLKIDVSPHPHVVRAADLDGDGRIDLAVDHRDALGVLILRGLGNGLFEQPGILAAVAGDPYRGFALGDLNRDGFLDIVTPNPNEVGLLLTTEDPLNFKRAEPLPAASPFAVEIGDFNGDGWLDVIAAAGERSPHVHIFFGDSSGRFKEAGRSPFRLALGGKNLIVGDFNGDGLDDAAVAAWQSTDVTVIFGGADPQVAGTVPGVEHPWGLAAADLNEDGRDDLIVADDTSQTLTIFLTSQSLFE